MRLLERPDGTADYDVAVQLNTLQIARMTIKNHKRSDGWAALLQRIVDEENRRAKSTPGKKRNK